jgi:hypothetical protein
VDERQFDRIVRSWATRTNRRRALRFMGIGSLVAWWQRTGPDSAAQETQEPVPCAQDADCLDGDADACTGATCVDGFCTYFIVDCIPGHICCGNGACCPVEEGGSCLADTDCLVVSEDPCAGTRCEGGSCVPFLATCAPDFACCGNGVCCPVGDGCAEDESSRWRRHEPVQNRTRNASLPPSWRSSESVRCPAATPASPLNWVPD